MPWVSLHAIALLALPFVTVAACLLLPRRRPDGRQVTIATVIGGATVFIVHGANAHLCLAGNPGMPCLIVGACLWIVLAFVKGKRTRIGLAVVLTGIMFLLSHHYVDLVHGKEWVGNVGSLTAYEKMNHDRLIDLQEAVKRLDTTDETAYPEGWLRTLPIGRKLDERLTAHPPRVEWQRVWHTSFTHLYRTTEIRQDFWYPGGRPDDAAAGIELRDVP